jgi:hypothetical protein
VEVNGQPMGAGDGATVSGEARLAVAARESSEVMLFDLA